MAEEYTGVSVADGVLTVTSDAQAGTITVQIVKSNLVIATKNIVIEENLAESSANLIAGGTFEDDTYEAAMETQLFSHPNIIGLTTEEKNSGNSSLEIEQPKTYYPAVFKANVAAGGIYKFTAYVKLRSDSVTTRANMTVSTKVGGGDRYNGIYVLQDETLDGTLRDAGYDWRANNVTIFNTTDWTKFERYVYVSDTMDKDTITAYFGVKNTGDSGNFYYYIDDVSLIKVGDAKLTVGANYIDIPADSATLNCAFASDVTADNAVVALAADKAGVTYADGVITVTNEATPGVITVQVTEGTTVVAEKDIVLFDATGKIIEVANDGEGNVTYSAYMKESVQASAKLLMAKYGTAFEDVTISNSKDMGDFWKISKSAELESGTYKFMLWDGLGTMKPLADAETVTVQ